jgi:ectoine hydroxylase-related dioxygenase (phytanoyl-CoA dioxygenase family)
MAIACLAAEAEHAADKLARRGYALLDGSDVDLAQAAAVFDALRAESEEPLSIAPDHALVETLLAQPAVRELVVEAVGPAAAVVNAAASDQQGHASWSLPWHQAPCAADPRRGLILRWHLDLIAPADGGLRVLPGSHTKGRLAAEEIAALAKETPAVELPVSAGTVLALRPLLVQSARRRTTQGHRRILQVELAPRL